HSWERTFGVPHRDCRGFQSLPCQSVSAYDGDPQSLRNSVRQILPRAICECQRTIPYSNLGNRLHDGRRNIRHHPLITHPRTGTYAGWRNQRHIHVPNWIHFHRTRLGAITQAQTRNLRKHQDRKRANAPSNMWCHCLRSRSNILGHQRFNASSIPRPNHISYNPYTRSLLVRLLFPEKQEDGRRPEDIDVGDSARVISTPSFFYTSTPQVYYGNLNGPLPSD